MNPLFSIMAVAVVVHVGVDIVVGMQEQAELFLWALPISRREAGRVIGRDGKCLLPEGLTEHFRGGQPRGIAGGNHGTIATVEYGRMGII